MNAVGYYIYVIADADWNYVYVGMSRIESRLRFKDHAKKWPGCRMLLCEEIGERDRRKEAKWICYFLAHSEPLTNRNLRGGGGVDQHSHESRQKMAEAARKVHARRRQPT